MGCGQSSSAKTTVFHEIPVDRCRHTVASETQIITRLPPAALKKRMVPKREVEEDAADTEVPDFLSMEGSPMHDGKPTPPCWCLHEAKKLEMKRFLRKMDMRPDQLQARVDRARRRDFGMEIFAPVALDASDEGLGNGLQHAQMQGENRKGSNPSSLKMSL
mmetsp:Transcript_55763/g.132936  ORF Transcript_55763/g.132936 Transcript_55763/m.132936 type:complete len:161 (+) Transcript_55763:78-560(+)